MPQGTNRQTVGLVEEEEPRDGAGTAGVHGEDAENSGDFDGGVMLGQGGMELVSHLRPFFDTGGLLSIVTRQ